MLNLVLKAFNKYREHRFFILLLAGLASCLLLAVFASYTQPRQRSTTQTAQFLVSEAQVMEVFKKQGLRTEETILAANAQDLSYTVTRTDVWGSALLLGSVSVMPSSGGSKLIWTLTQDAGYHPLRRWLAGAVMADQTDALQARLQALKLVLNAAPAASVQAKP